MKPVIILLLAAQVLLSGCSSTQTFSTTVRAGDTVSNALGMQEGVARDNISITFTPVGGGAGITYLPGDPAIRGVVNLYPDPVSRMIVGGQTSQELGTYASTYNSTLEYTISNQSKDWWTTLVVFDVPATLPVGTYSVDMVSNGTGLNSSTVEVVDVGGSPNVFDTHEGGPLVPEMIYSMERAENYAIKFTGTTVPYALQVEFTHAPDATVGGAGKPYVLNPRGDIKSVAWSDDGTSMRVIVTPTRSALSNIKHFNFYVAGGITGLTPSTVEAYDVNGNVVGGVSATITASN